MNETIKLKWKVSKIQIVIRISDEEEKKEKGKGPNSIEMNHYDGISGFFGFERVGRTQSGHIREFVILQAYSQTNTFTIYILLYYTYHLPDTLQYKRQKGY